MNYKTPSVLVFTCPELPYERLFIEKTSLSGIERFSLFQGKMETVYCIPDEASCLGAYSRVKDGVLLETKVDGKVCVTELSKDVLWALEAVTGEYAVANYVYICKRIPFGTYNGNKEVAQAETEYFRGFVPKIEKKETFSYDQSPDYLYGSSSKSKKRKS